MDQGHWEAVYRRGGPHSWDQDRAGVDLSLLDEDRVPASAAVVDIGGGDGVFARAARERGHLDVTVVDLAATALDAGRRRLGPEQSAVTWVQADVRTWRPERVWDVWHDRAAFHFFTEAGDRDGYRVALRAATQVGSRVLVGTFAADGPTHCSSLEVARYSTAGLVAELSCAPGLDLELVTTADEQHRTPHGALQHFTWVLLRRVG